MRAGRLSPYLAAAAGGVIGAWGRYWLALAWPTDLQGAGWPTATSVTNTVGCALLGAVLVIAMELAPLGAARPRMRLLRPFVVTGVLGGFTTFSTFALEVAELSRSGAVGTAVIYTSASVVGGVAVFALVVAVGEMLFDAIRRPGAHRGPVGGVVVVEEAEAVTEEEA